MAQRLSKFEIHKADNGQFYGVLIGRNGEILSTTETMHNKADVLKNKKAQKAAFAGLKTIDLTEPIAVKEEEANDAPKAEKATKTEKKETVVEKIKKAVTKKAKK